MPKVWSFADWLAETKCLQTLIAEDPAAMAGSSRQDFVRVQVLAAIKELTEVLDEFPWKPWRKTQLPESRERAIAELVDVMAFVANLLVMLEATGEEVSGQYEATIRKVVDRHYGGY